MLFLAATGLAILLEVGGPLVAMALVAWLARPRATAGVWGAGLLAVPLGAALFLCAMFLKTVASPGEIREPGFGPLLVHGLTAGFVVAVAEEGIRFGAAAVLFRRAQGRPLVAGVLFGLGWAWIECVYVAILQLGGALITLEYMDDVVNGAWSVAGLLAAVERLGAVLLHAGLAGWAAAAAMALARGRAAMAAALFAGAIAVHAGLDAWIVVANAQWAQRFGQGDWAALPGTLLMEAVFVAGGAAALAAAWKLPAVDATGAAPPPAS